MNPYIQPSIVFFFLFYFFFKGIFTKGLYDEHITPHQIQNLFSQTLNDYLNSREPTALKAALLKDFQ